MRNRRRFHRSFYLLLLLGAGLVLALSVKTMVGVFFSVRYITPIDGIDVCPGDVIHYNVDVQVNYYPDQLHIVENWCVAGENGRCDYANSTDYWGAALTFRDVTGIASRTVTTNPRYATPGAVLELHHTVKNGETTGYIVGPITIAKDCE